jgi:hypothetical protein
LKLLQNRHLRLTILNPLLPASAFRSTVQNCQEYLVVVITSTRTHTLLHIFTCRRCYHKWHILMEIPWFLWRQKCVISCLISFGTVMHT